MQDSINNWHHNQFNCRRLFFRRWSLTCRCCCSDNSHKSLRGGVLERTWWPAHSHFKVGPAPRLLLLWTCQSACTFRWQHVDVGSQWSAAVSRHHRQQGKWLRVSVCHRPLHRRWGQELVILGFGWDVDVHVLQLGQTPPLQFMTHCCLLEMRHSSWSGQLLYFSLPFVLHQKD